MADASAVALGELLLARGGPADLPEARAAGTAPVADWVEVLRADPALALWVAAVADRWGAPRPDGLSSLASWFARHALEVLQWQPADPLRPEADPHRTEEAGDRVAAAAAAGELASHLATDQGRIVCDRAALFGLLPDAGAWLAESEEASSGQPSPWPAWLNDPSARLLPGADAADLAARILRGEAAMPPSAAIDLERYRGRGAEARRRWLAPCDPAAGWLPLVTARLARLVALESHFDETVEAAKLEAMAEFAAGAGHEINNPLAVIAGRAQLFLREETDLERRRALALINAQAMRIYEMIADMRLFARPPQLESRRLELVALVDRLIEELGPRAAEQETTICRSGLSEPIEVEADPVQLMVALRALCQNALEALGYRGHVEVAVCRGDEGVEISVSDDGPGIRPEERRHLFDPFYSARQAGRGLGMGLAKCWRIITRHGGRITVESGPGQGAIFTIRLPAGPRSNSCNPPRAE